MSSFASIGGIASGLDTGAIIDQLLQLERRPLQLIANQQAAWRRTDQAWGDVLTRLSSVRNAVDALREPGALTSPTQVTSSDPAIASATRTGAGAVGSTAVTVDALATAHRVAVGGSVADPTAPLGPGTLTITRADGTEVATVTVGPDDTLADVARQLDGLDGIGAQIVRTGTDAHRLVVTASSTGVDGAFTVTGDVPALAGSEVLTAGADAELRLGGLAITRSSNVVGDLLEGVELRLTGTGTVQVGVAADTDASLKLVADLVTTVNGALDHLARISNTSATAGDRGLLAGDALVRQLTTSLRGVVASVTGDGDLATPSAIGISLTRDGRLTLDEDALRRAFTDDPAAVAALVGRPRTATDDPAGLAGAFDRVLRDAEGRDGTIARAREGLTERIRAADGSIEAAQVRLETRERTLRAQFTALEVALSRLQGQSSWLVSQLNGLDSQR